jgi:DNA-binding CsgD family transcriptional regulator
MPSLDRAAVGELVRAEKHIVESMRSRNIQLSEMLDLIYEGPLESRPWQAFVDSLRHATNAVRVSIQLYRPEDAEHDVRVTASTHPDSKVDWRLLRDTYQQDYLASDPIRHFNLRPGQVVTLDDCHGTAFRDELLVPMGIDHYVRTSFTEPGGMSAWLQMIGHKPTAAFDKTHAVELLQELLPHLGRALRVYARILVNQGEKAVYQKAISHLAFGTVMLDGRGRVLDSNLIANRMISRNSNISITSGKLVISNSEVNQELQAAISTAIQVKKEQLGSEHVELVRLRTTCGALIGFLIIPTPSIVLYQGDKTPNVIVYMCDLEQHIGDQQDRRNSAEQLVAKLFKLTPSEATLAVMLADGLTMSEAATAMGITEGSARSYSKRIYEKTDIRRQSDLIRLIYRSVALLG